MLVVGSKKNTQKRNNYKIVKERDGFTRSTTAHHIRVSHAKRIDKKVKHILCKCTAYPIVIKTLP